MKLKDFVDQISVIYDECKNNSHGVEPEINFCVMSDHDLDVDKFEIDVNRWMGCGCWTGATIDIYLKEEEWPSN